LNTPNCLLLTIVCEAVLEPFLEEELPPLGVTGYTITDARGLGTHGRRSGAWRKEGNIRVEILCSPALAERVAEHLRKEYEANYGLADLFQPGAGA
jgi:hypothetical protein